MQKLKKNRPVVSKMTRMWWNLIRALESLQNLHFHLLPLCKVFDLKKYRRVIFYDTKTWWKIWRKTDLEFGKWHEEWDPWIQSRKSIHRGVMCHDIKEWCKIWRGIDLPFQNWHEEFDEFWPEHLKVSKIFMSMYILFELKKYSGVFFHDIEELCKIWRKSDLSFGKWHEEV